MPQFPHADTRLRQTETHTGAGKDGTGIPKPASHIGRKTGEFPGSQLTSPEILTTGIGHGTRQLGQGRAHAQRDDRNPNQTIHKENSASGTDTGDQGGGDTEPRIGHTEGDANEGEDGKVALQVLGVAHLGQAQGIVVLGPGGIFGGGGVDAGLLFYIKVAHGVSYQGRGKAEMVLGQHSSNGPECCREIGVAGIKTVA